MISKCLFPTLRRLWIALSLGAAGLSAPVWAGFELDIFHINDHHSHLDANKLDLKLAGERTRVKAGGFPMLASAIKRLSGGADNVLKLHAGDALSGDLYYTLFKGEANAALMNALCFDAFALGNHEFDDGDAGLAGFIDYLRAGDCSTPVLAANVIPAVGKSPLAPNSANDYIQPWTIVERGGERIGLIGIDISRKTRESSSPDPATRFLDETISAQSAIDTLESQGVDKIVVITHYQFANDLAMARALSGVDVIVGGDSHTLLGRELEAVGLRPKDDYPVTVQNADGDKVCVVTAWEYAKVLGHLEVAFDAQGKVTACGGRPYLLIGDSFKRKNAQRKRVELEGAERDAVLAEVSANASILVVAPDAATEALLTGFRAKVEQMVAAPIGEARTTLCLERIPGQGKSRACDKAATGSRGSDISNIVARAFLEMSLTSELALQNGGGVRIDILAGPITVGDAYKLLPFSNTLVELEMSGAEIKRSLEESFDYAVAEDGSTGAYPYASGLRWTADRSKPFGQRIRNLEVNLRMASGWAPIDSARSYKVVTNNYIAGGKDGYKTLGAVSRRGDASNTYLDYAQSFVDYVKAVGNVGKLPAAEYSTQIYIDENGVRQ